MSATAALARRMRDYYHRIRETYGMPVISLTPLADEHPHWRPASSMAGGSGA
ncbi:hypothetical protein FHW83_000923 [Duganella sp. SG902]|uniref:hypothetical protein n=1 Tax=Duganella sp. SG902 TaxID=2587016 RepID=UPI00159E9EA8|nr:hypothetical protein [Duganella sp. SG902]NVM75143.1 hypothetical protein [Duganella sp. SG902]